MLLGRSILFWIITAVVAVAVFLVLQWALPAVLIAIFGTAPPLTITNLLAFLIAIGIVLGAYRGVPA